MQYSHTSIVRSSGRGQLPYTSNNVPSLERTKRLYREGLGYFHVSEKERYIHTALTQEQARLTGQLKTPSVMEWVMGPRTGRDSRGVESCPSKQASWTNKSKHGLQKDRDSTHMHEADPRRPLYLQLPYPPSLARGYGMARFDTNKIRSIGTTKL